MAEKCTEQGEVGQPVFDDSNACSTEARHPVFGDNDCEKDSVLRLGIWGGILFQPLVSDGKQGRHEWFSVTRFVFSF